MTLLVARVKFIKTKVILGIMPKASQTELRNQKLLMFKFQYQGGKKQKSEKNFWVTKRGIKWIINRAMF